VAIEGKLKCEIAEERALRNFSRMMTLRVIKDIVSSTDFRLKEIIRKSH
jgi:hypothetical protein